jgi:DNA (cytosine-5)-methyltransferase 1
MKNLKFIHLFSGIGAPESALKRLDIPVDFVGFSEIDKYAITSYRAMHKESQNNLGDIEKIEQLPECDMVMIKKKIIVII